MLRNNPQKVCLTAGKDVWYTFLKVTPMFRLLSTFYLKMMRPRWERKTQEYSLIKNVGLELKSVLANRLKHEHFGSDMKIQGTIFCTQSFIIKNFTLKTKIKKIFLKQQLNKMQTVFKYFRKLKFRVWDGHLPINPIPTKWWFNKY